METRKPKLKLLKIKSIKINDSIYPRDKVDFITTARYINAMKSGAVFPPIKVAKIGFKYYLIDGGHRIQASKGCKQTHIQAEVYEGLTEKQIYLEAVRLNTQHGKQFTTYEVTNIIVRLRDFKLKPKQIADLVRIPATNLTSFVAKRMTRITDVKGNQSNIVLKKPFTHLAGGNEIDLDSNVEEVQHKFYGVSQEHLLDEVLKLIKNNLIDFKNKSVKAKFKKLKKLFTAYELP